MKYFKKLVGERIYLSPVNIEDVEKYVEWFCDFTMTDGVGRSGEVMTIKGEKEYLENATNNKLDFAIVKLENDKLIIALDKGQGLYQFFVPLDEINDIIADCESTLRDKLELLLIKKETAHNKNTINEKADIN